MGIRPFIDYANSFPEITNLVGTAEVFTNDGGLKKADFSNLEKSLKVHNTLNSGVLSLPTLTKNSGNNALLDVSGMSALISYTDNGFFRSENDWTLDTITGLNLFTGAPATQQNKWLVITPDFTTKDTTRKLKYVIRDGYKNIGINPTEAVNSVLYAPITRDTTTGLLTTLLRYGKDYGFSNYQWASALIGGTTKLFGFDPFLELAPSGGAVGSYIGIGAGAAITAGRFIDTSIYKSCEGVSTATVGGASNTSRGLAGASTTGVEGQIIDRQFGANSRVPSPVYEPTPALVLADFLALPSNRWATYKLEFYVGSNLLMYQCQNTTYTSLESSIAAAHPYDVTYNALDRFIPSFHVGYLAVKQGFNPNVSWASNAGLYQLYNTEKVAIN